MRPYTVEKINGRDERVLWSAEKSDLMLNKFKDEARAELRAIECDKARKAGIAHLIQTCEDGTERLLPVHEEEVNGAMTTVIDPIAAKLKHTGAETTDLYREKWIEFCKVPQNPGMLELLPPYVRKSGVTERTAGDLSPITETPIAEEPPKRKRGRPRNSDKL